MTLVQDAQERAARAGRVDLPVGPTPPVGPGSGPGRVVGGAIAYFVITFPLAVVWHILLFEEQYRAMGYLGRAEPSFALGAVAIAVQGLVMSWAYPRFAGSGSPVVEGLRFAAVAGIFHWSGHVVASAAKWEIAPLGTFVAMETGYLAINFVLFGVVLGLVHGRQPESTS